MKGSSCTMPVKLQRVSSSNNDGQIGLVGIGNVWCVMRGFSFLDIGHVCFRMFTKAVYYRTKTRLFPPPDV